MYPEQEPYFKDYLDVGDGHTLYYEQCGNPDGLPVVFLHGGPGGGFHVDSRRLFDPNKYRIILFDQRGAGRSRPYASLSDNTISHLISDIEKIRQAVDVDKWMVCGGSWGSALSLLYAIAHKEHVKRLIVTGISLADPYGVNWFVEEGGVSRMMPDWFEAYKQFIPPEKREQGLGRAYYDILVNGDPEDPHVIEAAKNFDLWDTSILRHNIPKDILSEIKQNPEESVALGRIFFYFITHEYKDGNKWHILDNAKKMGDIPCDIIHGRYDMICPAENAWALHSAYTNSNIHVVEDGGHSILDEGMARKVIELTDSFDE